MTENLMQVAVRQAVERIARHVDAEIRAHLETLATPPRLILRREPSMPWRVTVDEGS
jgi:hypothetical protein